MKRELNVKTKVKVFCCSKGSISTSGFVAVSGRITHSAQPLRLIAGQELTAAVQWLEARGWKVERIDVG